MLLPADPGNLPESLLHRFILTALHEFRRPVGKLLRLLGKNLPNLRAVPIIEDPCFFIEVKLDHLPCLLIGMADSFFPKTDAAYPYAKYIFLIHTAPEAGCGDTGQPLLHQAVPVKIRHIQKAAEDPLPQIHTFCIVSSGILRRARRLPGSSFQLPYQLS